MSEMSEEMSEPTPPTSRQASAERAKTAYARTPRFRITAVVVILLVGGIIAWLALRNTSSSSSQSRVTQAAAVTPTQINSLASSSHHPVFWLGSRSGQTLELTQSPNGTIFIRYLPKGVEIGSPNPYLTVATYPFPGAYAGLSKVAKQAGETSIPIGNHGIALVSSSYPDSVHIAFPGVDYQVEVYDPTPGNATALVASGEVKAVGKLTASSAATRPTAATAAGLRALAKSLGHPLYWVGAKSADTYELSQTSTGQVYIRYLPNGVPLGSSKTFLTVATYPYPGALTAIQGLSKEHGMQSIKLSGGGLAVIDPKDPESVHLAFPGSAYEVEVFSPSPAAARQLVASGQVSAIR
jgi:hypothetical protein